MKCDELEFFFGGAASWAEVYKKSDVDAAIDELKARIHELESMPHTDNSAVIELLSDELEKLRPMEAALEIAEANNKKYIERIKELEAENERLKEAQRWRNFKDEPPEHHQWIEACYCEDRINERLPRIEVRRWDDGMKYDVFDQELYIGWRPLPKAPEDK